MSLTKVTYAMIQGSPVNLLDFGADPTGVDDCSAALTAAIAASNNIFIPAGEYKFTSVFTVTGSRGLTIQGESSALFSSGLGYAKCTTLNFSSASSGANGLVITDFVGLTLKNFTIRQLRSGSGGGNGLFLYNGHDYTLDHIDVDIDAGAAASGIKLGDGSGATSTFIGNIKNCKIIANGGIAISANVGTSLTFESCYGISGGFVLNGLAYSSLISCAVDVAPSYAYSIGGSLAMVFDACGAEQAGKSAFYVNTTSSNIIFNSPYGAANNTSGDLVVGDLFYLDSAAGAVRNITITSPAAIDPDPATTFNIVGTAGTIGTEIYNTNNEFLGLGIGGNTAWLQTQVTITGYWALQTWTPTLVSWTNVGAPTFETTYIKNGNIATFSITITPGTSISSTQGTSRITGLPVLLGTAKAGSAMMTDGNTVSYGNCVVDENGAIFMQTSGVLTTSILLVGTLIF